MNTRNIRPYFSKKQQPTKRIISLVEASKLPTSNIIMKHTPNSKNEQELKDYIMEFIQKGAYDFYRPIMDPCLDQKFRICYAPGFYSSLYFDPESWEKLALEYAPERKSRLGTELEYSAFIGVLIIKLVTQKGWSVEKAWHTVCDNSKEIGNYRDYWENVARRKDSLTRDLSVTFRYLVNIQRFINEPTGSRKVCGFYDLANTYKVLKYSKYPNDYYCYASCPCVNERDSLSTEPNKWFHPISYIYPFRVESYMIFDKPNVAWVVLF